MLAPTTDVERRALEDYQPLARGICCHVCWKEGSTQLMVLVGECTASVYFEEENVSLDQLVFQLVPPFLTSQPFVGQLRSRFVRQAGGGRLGPGRMKKVYPRALPQLRGCVLVRK